MKKSSKEIYPAKPKGKPYGGKKDEESKEQKAENTMPARTPRDFSNKSLKELRKLKKEYRV